MVKYKYDTDTMIEKIRENERKKVKYHFALRGDIIALKDIDKETKELLESSVPHEAVPCPKGQEIGIYLLDFIDTTKHQLFNKKYEKNCVVYVNTKDVSPVTINHQRYYLTDYSAIKVIAFPDENNRDGSNVYKINSLFKSEESNNDTKVNPSSYLFNDVLSNVYSELASMNIEYKKNNVPESCEHYVNALDELQRLRLWG